MKNKQTQIHKTARTAFASGRTRSIDFRQQQLSQLAYLISDNHSAIVRAIKQDLGRCEFESDVCVFAFLMRPNFDRLGQP
jgi:aldehyde dehydrogenase (NAD+)